MTETVEAQRITPTLWRTGDGEYRVPRVLEAAIRAPLEERIRELERDLEFERMGRAAVEGTLARVTAEGVAVRAENTRLREALGESIEVIDAYVEQGIKPFKVDEWRELLVTSSTKATEGGCKFSHNNGFRDEDGVWWCRTCEAESLEVAALDYALARASAASDEELQA